MNCIELRRRLLESPGDHREDIQTHLELCESCREFASRSQAIEKELAVALSLEVPEHLTSRILLRQSTSIEKLNRNRRRWWGAIAASVVLIFGFAGMLVVNNYPTSLNATVLAHVNSELRHLNDRTNVQLAQVNKILLPFGSQVLKPIGRVRYAGTCRIRNYDGAHLVVTSELGVVTLLWMPGEYVSSSRNLSDDRFTGIIVPTKTGSVAIVGENLESVKLFENRLRTLGSLAS
ncbi:MAG: DUF3379 family protein [Acidiferrobacterales bacterium]